jgi:hypothetical protein
VNAKGEYTACYATTDTPRFQSLAYTDYYHYDSKRIEGDDGTYIYALVSATRVGDTITCSYRVRVLLNNYFQYRYGHEANFLFGTNQKGQDILTRLASGARFSLILAIYAYTDANEVEFIQSQTTKCGSEKVTLGAQSLYTVTYASVKAGNSTLANLGEYIMPSQKPKV